MLTMEEHIAKPLKDCKVVFVGDIRNNMCYAWMYGCAKMGMTFVGYGPQTLIDEVDPQVLRQVAEVSAETLAAWGAPTCSTATFGPPWARKIRSLSVPSYSPPTASTAPCLLPPAIPR